MIRFVTEIVLDYDIFKEVEELGHYCLSGHRRPAMVHVFGQCLSGHRRPAMVHVFGQPVS